MVASARMLGDSKDGQVAMAELDEQQFARWAALLEQRLGIAITPQRRTFLSSRLRMRMREIQFGDDFERYYQLVTSSQQGAVEWSCLQDRLTVHETCFNRHPASFKLIEECYLPELMSQSNGVLNIKAWSVGCASGEEAYYLAMILDRTLEAYQDKSYYGVIGSDVSLDSLALARRGSYAEQRLRGLDSKTVERYLEPCAGDYRVIKDVRQRVAFSQINVQRLEQAPLEKVDIIFCQNLLIYFTAPKRREIVAALARFLKLGGVLVLGVGEIVGWQPEGLEVLKFEDTLAYRRVKD